MKINPSGNITLLVTGDVSRKSQGETARKLMEKFQDVEQVGFLEKAACPEAKMRLQMMGGEFCGNATMSVAAYLAGRDRLGDGEAAVYPLEVSGCQDVISCRIVRDGDAYIGTVPMPLPQCIAETEILPGVKVPRVCFEGIEHLIVPETILSERQAEDKIAALCAFFDAEALGILLMGNDAIRPLVYVRSTGSAVWENSCGSGTAAVGAWRAFVQEMDVHMEIAQPGPNIRIGVSARYEKGRIRGLEITGRVRIEESFDVQL